MNLALWILQVLLGLLFVWAGGFKLVVPIATMTSQMPTPLPGWFLRCIGVAELLGGLGLLLVVVAYGRWRLRPVRAQS